ncbi:MAG: DinB family protein [bacterium]
MTLKDLLLYLLEYTYEKEGAYPPLATALVGLTVAQASWKPAPERHSIWQIVRHMTQWMEAGLVAIEAQPRVYEDLQQSDWRAASGGEREWQADVERLHRAYRRLKERLTAMSEEDLAGMLEPYRGKPRYATALRFLRTATHDTYHLGQIRYLRALQGA